MPLVARTPHTQTDVEAIRLELATVRSRGYALIDQEVELGLRSIAVPILNSRGTTVAAMNIGVAAMQHDVGDLVGLYLKAMLDLQHELRSLLHYECSCPSLPSGQLKHVGREAERDAAALLGG